MLGTADIRAEGLGDGDIAIYRIYREYVVHEDDLINNRVGWFIQLHSFLIATYGIVVTAIITTFFAEHGPQIHAAWPQGFACLLLAGIAVVGLLSSLAAKQSIDAADQAIRTLRQSWLLVLGDRDRGKLLPGLTGGGNIGVAKLGARFHLRLPVALSVLWCVSFIFPVAFLVMALLNQQPPADKREGAAPTSVPSTRPGAAFPPKQS